MNINSIESPFEKLEQEGKSTFVTKLQEFFPESADFIKAEADSKLGKLEKEMQEFNETKLPFKLTVEQQNVILDFYNLKREKFLRDFFRISSLMAIENLLKKIDTYNAEKTSQIKPDSVIEDLQYNGIIIKFNDGNIEALNDDNTRLFGLKEEELRPLRAHILSIINKIKPDELGTEEQRMIESALNTEDESDLSEGAKDLLSLTGSKIQLFNFVKSTPALLNDFQMIFKKQIDYKHRYSMAKIKETSSMISELIRGEDVGKFSEKETVLDLCCGEGDMSIILRRMGVQIEGIDISKQSLKSAAIFSQLSTDGPNDFIKKRDVITDELPKATTWISKHPCAPGLAIPDEIIKRFTEDETAKKLILLTCCADKAIKCCPGSYIEEGIITDEEWDYNCKESSGTLFVNAAQKAMRKLNEARIKHIELTTDFGAKMVEIQGSVMNQMIIINKKNE